MKYYEGNWKYQLAFNTEFKTSFRPSKAIVTKYIRLYKNGTLVILAGYAWDGPSGPTWDTKTAMRGSLLHDALFQLIRMGLLPEASWKQANTEFGKVLEEDGMWWLRRKNWIFQLNNFGKSASMPKNRRVMKEAP